MSKIYELYGPDQRKIDNLKRRIRGYQKMEKDLQRDIRKTNNKNRELQQRIDKAIEYIEENIHFCENDSQGAYDVCNIRIRSDKKLLEILRGEDNE